MDEKTKTQKEQKKERRRKFTSQMWTIILGTTISLIVTIVAAQILERNRRAKDRRLSAMMVMSNIESYAQILESAYDYMGHADTVSAWLLDLPLDKVDSLDQNSLLSLMDEVMYIPIFVYDKTAEGIFTCIPSRKNGPPSLKRWMKFAMQSSITQSNIQAARGAQNT